MPNDNGVTTYIHQPNDDAVYLKIDTTHGCTSAMLQHAINYLLRLAEQAKVSEANDPHL